MFIKINDEGINTAEIVGWFTLKTMEDYAKRKNGQFKCQYGTWHQRGDVCNCAENVKYEKFSYKIKR